MIVYQVRRVLGVLLGCLLLAVTSWAQTPDPTFAPPALYMAASAYVAFQQSDGARVLANGFSRAESHASPGLARYLPSGQPDAGFNARVAAQQLPVPIMALAETANRHLLLLSENGVTRLRPDGTLDPEFRAGGATFGSALVMHVQPDGRILVGGGFTQFRGRAVGRLVRLLSNGELDESFEAAGKGARDNGALLSLALQADGKILAAGNFEPGPEQPHRALLRLLPDGRSDLSFAPQVSPDALLSHVVVQPDGRLLVAAYNSTRPLSSSPQVLVRLTSTGQLDPTFQAADHFAPRLAIGQSLLLVQPDGRLLVGTGQQADLPGRGNVVRLLADGRPDASWQTPYFGGFDRPYGLQLLPNGQVLASGATFRLEASELPIGAALLGANGALDTSFAPKLQNPGEVGQMVAQADGQLLISGAFSEINGEPVRFLARIKADGGLDIPFSRACRLSSSRSASITARLALQPNGQLVVGGNFESVGGKASPSLVRLLLSGEPDPTFVSGLKGEVQFDCLGLQADGSIVVVGAGLISGPNSSATVVRFQPNGQPDLTFSSPPGWWLGRGMVIQPDDRIVVAGYLPGPDGSAGASVLRRLMPNGAPDDTFAALDAAPGLSLFSVRRTTAGALLIGGQFRAIQGHSTINLARLRTDGSVDQSFSSNLTLPGLEALSLQPDGKVLVGNGKLGLPSQLLRLRADGNPDPSFKEVSVLGIVRCSLTLPNGAIVVGGSFSDVAGQPSGGLSRLLAPTVLAVPASRLRADTRAWPVPARSTLHVNLVPEAGPRTVHLLTLAGREVYRSAATTTQMQVPVGHLAAGLYLLRVEYADGPVTRRVVVE
ncbi:hypothetical protein CDA63_03070 [Hymenobacter amundsenii]|uniref:Secretion system C-terminal sorting domain-containing protein n=1 Tax=Hymenobacter amundsenii TaxID=2006685 RepID=A0A246FPS5_9BACT|nr:T9SS type A sorting domain-containing protein [Hymenobacter amundsenii]OWP64755.1 hypothetical protein CDA63_03070 [Hymenobacter amundsenii]